MSTQYPILDNRPINKWKVAELKEELKRRNLTTKGLKDDLVKRLDEAIRNERAAAEAEEPKVYGGETEHVGKFVDTKVKSSPLQIANEDLEHQRSEVPKIYETSTRVDIDDGPTKIGQGQALKLEETGGTEPITMPGESAVAKAPLALSNIQEGIVLPDITSSEDTLGNKIISKENAVLESSQKDAVLVDEAVTLEATMQSISEVVDSQVHQTLDDKNIKAQNDEVEGVNLAPDKAVENVEVKPEDISLTYSKKDAVLVGEPVTLDPTVQKIGEAVDGQVHQTLEDKSVKIYNNEVEGTDLPFDKAVENIEVKPEDMSLKPCQTDADRGEPYSSDQVYEVSHNLGLQVKSESFSNDTLTINEKNKLKENLTADNVQLEPEITKPEMVQPSSSRDPPGDGILHPSDDPVPHGNQTLDGQTDDDRSKNIEFSKKIDNADEISVDVPVEHNLENEATEKVECDNELNQMSFVKDISPVSGFSPDPREPSAEEKIDIATSGEGRKPQDDNDFSRTADGAEGDLLEKVNLDQSSGDDSMEEDISETRHVDSDHILSKVGETTDLNKESGVGEGDNIAVTQHITPSDKLDSSTAHKDSGVALSEKRKFQDATEAENKEAPKRQRRWNTENQEVPESQSSGAILSPKPKASLLTASAKPNLTRSNSKLGGEAPKERVAPLSQKTPTTSLRIDNFVRPFTLKAVQELLAKTGRVSSFWMDHIKTHCYVTYSSVEEAIETRNAVYNLQWPPNGGRHLIADFVDPEEVKLRVETPSQSAAPSLNASTSAVTAEAPSQPAVTTPQQIPRQHYEPQHPLSRQPPPRNTSAMKEQLPKVPSPVAEKTDPPIVTLDDLFRKTRATPRIYYLPLTDEQVATKLARQRREKM